MSEFRATFAKDRQKFSAAHFTLFEDGSLERLHGHNYNVTVTFEGTAAELGLMFSFHDAKALVKELCDAWDERVLIPSVSPWIEVTERDAQLEVVVTTPKHRKFYSFPREDVVLLACDNASCEHLTRLFADAVAAQLHRLGNAVTGFEVAISESAGQTIALSRSI
ncbi:6-carboxy-5,6,7,8-tetrahydropterin synthase [Sulfidibacter corallicola]|uniref:6-carboxy-5,6,7,8-tetrahydropterin synthase n=1 Tax=Sulfidibacter corallicola TaxID=2818388 RepID=A0A8A4TPI6_SULCO|nr:6-carboxytetrahydropterin synthase [Sulfidibacter corallicola]QTD50821.1 6-carboxytetrahydropterin synthase [Sulfidibacter corallicola]